VNENLIGRQVAIYVKRIVPPMGVADGDLGGTIVQDFGHAVRVHLRDGSLRDLATLDRGIGWRVLPKWTP
jgi:hypothetical protein